ncbi:MULTISPECIES: agmatinase [Paraclostridium]|uniref:Agmatinase n=2 Tax=Paraclostridium TaxID=1849822 RepID=A0A0M3DH80_9FIRM|nr:MULTISPECIES: agmatinase [Paraclostridium]EQK40602.1 agmatinase [[Clostridium] bifermentans ATCC 19299] [Paraclostridium bifermentans ATCC 19299]KKY01678.1 agmatinase [Paraclostridium benzoelyticum]MBN8046560.1 agmatinase [Paraclostridium bifermentans]MBZ6004899.1 agmatinase [Paraclostridium bifermentans]MCE9674542.1 agmatinase [Paraclostridium bifermentans]
MKNKFYNTPTFMSMDDSYEESKLVVFGAGFDGTTSNRPGTRFASSSMRPEFYGLETYSPILDLDMDDYKICDIGDLELSIGNTDTVLNEIYEGTKSIIKDNKVPFMIGGEHLVTLPAFKAVHEKYNDLYVLHFDAHTDLREEYNNNENSHATVIKRIWDIVGDNKIFQFGIRSGTKEEFEFALKYKHTYMETHTINTFKEIVDKLENKNIYLTIDLDVLDPSIFPGTGTPEPGGVTYKEFEGIFKILKNSNINLVGLDIVELSPDYDNTNVSTVTACKILRELALIVSDKIK